MYVVVYLAHVVVYLMQVVVHLMHVIIYLTQWSYISRMWSYMAGFDRALALRLRRHIQAHAPPSLPVEVPFEPSLHSFEPSLNASFRALSGCIISSPLWVHHPSPLCTRVALMLRRHELKSRRLFIMNTIPPWGIGAVGPISEGEVPSPYGKSYS